MDVTRQSPYAAPHTPIASAKRPRVSKSIKSPTPQKLSIQYERNENISTENRALSRKSSIRKDQSPEVPCTPSKIMFSPALRAEQIANARAKLKAQLAKGNAGDSGSSEDEFLIHSKDLEVEETPEVKETEQEADDMDDVFNPYLFIANLPSLSTVHDKDKICLPPPSNAEKPLPTLVLDLDETLVHCTVEPVPKPDLVFPVAFNGTVYQVYVRKRPYLDYFLETVSKHYEVVLFTASQKVYADVLLDKLDPQRKYFAHRLFREACLMAQGNYLKDLTVLGRNMRRTLLVDNSPHAYGYHVDNGVPIESWYDDDSDTELLKLIGFLRRTQIAEDVRPIVRDHFKSYQLVLNAKNGLPPVLSAPPF